MWFGSRRRIRFRSIPISTGNNWGYGDARPVRDGCVIVDLSQMNRIKSLDADLGVVTLEPGVTQEELHRYLQQHNLNFMVPTTGGGPSCSIIGNALERGYGITPQADHFHAVNWIEAVLPNGEIYRTPLTTSGAKTADQAFKWGIGPYLDGIFTQGAFGIVIQASIALARRPEIVEGFQFRIDSDHLLKPYTRCIRQLMSEVGSIVGGVNLMNAHRVLSMRIPYPTDTGHALLPGTQLRQLMRQEQVPYWTGVGSLYGPKPLVHAARTVVRKCLAPIDKRVRFVNSRMIDNRQRLSKAIPGASGPKLYRRLEQARSYLNVLEGTPSEVALPLSYWRSGVQKPASRLDPARDGCGLLWYAPLVPMKAENVYDSVAMARKVCFEHNIEPLITLTALSSRCFDMTIPILFTQKDDSQTASARRCYEALFSEGRKLGIMPYRVGIEAMPLLVNRSSYWRLVSALKATIDPKQIIAPGRYTL